MFEKLKEDLFKYRIKVKLNLNKGNYFFDFGLDIQAQNSLTHEDIFSSVMIINVENESDVVGVTKFENSIKNLINQK